MVAFFKTVGVNKGILCLNAKRLTAVFLKLPDYPANRILPPSIILF